MLLGIENVYKLWTKEETIECGKEFVEKNGSLTEKDLKAKNGLPTPKVIYRFFGTINDYQRAIDAPVKKVNQYISKHWYKQFVYRKDK